MMKMNNIPKFNFIDSDDVQLKSRKTGRHNDTRK